MEKDSDNKIIDVCIIEDDSEIRESLSILINGSKGFTCKNTYRNCDVAIKKLIDAPDAVLMDIEMPGTNGIEGVKILKKKFPKTEFLMLTISEKTDYVFASLCAGASGYLRKNTPPAKILSAITEVINGGSPMNMDIARMVVDSFKVNADEYQFTDREKEILQKLCDGHSYKMISDECNIDINTVKYHIKNIYGKMHVNSKGEAVSKALREKLL